MSSSGAPTRFYRYLRGQLGSLREVYGQGNQIVRRGDLGSKEDTVLLLHGFMQTRAVWQVMEDRLRYDGFGVFSFDLGGLLYRFNTKPIPELAAHIHDKLERICDRYGLESFHVVGHSKGGLIARHYIQHLEGHRRVRSLVTLGTPHHGTPTAVLGVALFGGGLLSRSPWQMLPGSETVKRLAEDTFPGHVPFTSIYSRSDLVCPYWSSHLNPRAGETSMRNVELSGVGHTALCYDPGVYRHVKSALLEGSALWKERRG
ncbi:MAG: alpha/beta fold hydrolase [Myxococcota bacterium]|nr:alpha/beta fold hydrolase [Myxococcota bacterium]